LTYNGQIYNEEGRRHGAPDSFFAVLAASCQRSSDERRLAIRNQHVLVACLNRERVILFLKPHKLGFQVAYSLLEAAHLGNHAGIGTADVAE
jgi:hypothetical protein